MRVKVIGYWGGFPKAEGATSCYLIEENSFKLLVDCGSGALSRLSRHLDPYELDAVILSHYHQDHIADIGVLQYTFLVQNQIQNKERVLPIYGHEEEKDKFESLHHMFTKGISYNPTQPLNIGPFEIQFLKTLHPVPCYGMRIESRTGAIVYTADTSFSNQWIDFSKDANLLITDCNFYHGMNGEQAGHMTSTEGAEIAKNAKVEELWLSHLPHFGEHEQLLEEASKEFNGEIRIAEEGLSREI
ncbi:MBL fold metallo-hydrolase [Bacillaceae bacterium S4-13-56]